MTESIEKKTLEGAKPTSFSLDRKVLNRLKEAHRKLEVSKTAFVTAAINELAARVESGEVQDLSVQAPILIRNTPLSPSAPADPLAGLSSDQLCVVRDLIEILKQQPQGAIFKNLDTTLQIAIGEYRKTRSAHAPAETKATRESPQPAHRKPTGTGRHH